LLPTPHFSISFRENGISAVNPIILPNFTRNGCSMSLGGVNDSLAEMMTEESRDSLLGASEGGGRKIGG
jgi:hypothetical protein